MNLANMSLENCMEYKCEVAENSHVDSKSKLSKYITLIVKCEFVRNSVHHWKYMKIHERNAKNPHKPGTEIFMKTL